MAISDLDQMSPLGIPVSISACCGFGCHLSLLWLRMQLWDLNSLVSEGRCKEGPEPSDKPVIDGKEHPAPHCPWLFNIYLSIQPCPWKFSFYSGFVEVDGDELFCLSHSISPPKKSHFLEKDLVKDMTLCLALLWLRHSWGFLLLLPCSQEAEFNSSFY